MSDAPTQKMALESISEDLSFLRSVAEGGQPGHQRKAGAILTGAGLSYSAATLVSYAVGAGGAPAWSANASWAGASLVFLALLFFVVRAGPRAQAVRERASGLAWGGLGGAIFSIILGFMVIANTVGSAAVFTGTPTVILALYGAAWMVAAGMSGLAWMRLLSLGAYAAAIGIGALAKGPGIYLGYAAALTLFATAPGIYLLTRRD